MTLARYYGNNSRLKLAIPGEILRISYGLVNLDKNSRLFIGGFLGLDNRFVRVTNRTVLSRWFRDYTLTLVLNNESNIYHFIMKFQNEDEVYDVDYFYNFAKFKVKSLVSLY